VSEIQMNFWDWLSEETPPVRTRPPSDVGRIPEQTGIAVGGRDLTFEEIEQLNRWHVGTWHHGPQYWRARPPRHRMAMRDPQEPITPRTLYLRIVWLAAKGHGIGPIVRRTGADARVVDTCIRRFRDASFPGVRGHLPNKRGPKSVLTDAHLARLRGAIIHDQTERWTLKDVIRFLKAETGHTFSASHVREVLADAGIVFKAGHGWVLNTEHARRKLPARRVRLPRTWLERDP